MSDSGALQPFRSAYSRIDAVTSPARPCQHEVVQPADANHRDTFARLEYWLKRHQRTDTAVYLNGPSGLSYGTSATPVQRSVAHLLRGHRWLRYRCGKLKLLSRGRGATATASGSSGPMRRGRQA